jgi:hypothetical protein
VSDCCYVRVKIVINQLQIRTASSVRNAVQSVIRAGQIPANIVQYIYIYIEREREKDSAKRHVLYIIIILKAMPNELLEPGTLNFI